MLVPLVYVVWFMVYKSISVIKIGKQLYKQVGKTIFILKYPSSFLSNQLINCLILNSNNWQYTSKHVNNFHRQIQLRTTLMQTYSNVTSTKNQRIIFSRYPFLFYTYLLPLSLLFFYFITKVFFLWTFSCYYYS
jgi:hypothetical protein